MKREAKSKTKQVNQPWRGGALRALLEGSPALVFFLDFMFVFVFIELASDLGFDPKRAGHIRNARVSPVLT